VISVSKVNINIKKAEEGTSGNYLNIVVSVLDLLKWTATPAS
jgi:hypothetical protein